MTYPRPFVWRLAIATVWLALSVFALIATASDMLDVSSASEYRTYGWRQFEIITIVALVASAMLAPIGIPALQMTCLHLKWAELRKRALIARYGDARDVDALFLRIARAWKLASDRDSPSLMARFERRFTIVRNAVRDRHGIQHPPFSAYIARA